MSTLSELTDSNPDLQHDRQSSQEDVDHGGSQAAAVGGDQVRYGRVRQVVVVVVVTLSQPVWSTRYFV